MIIEVTTRHTKVTGIQDYAEAKAQELGSAFPRIEHIQVVLDIQKHVHEAEFIIRGKHHLDVEAVGAADDFEPAIDAAHARAQRQLRKFEDRLQEHRKRYKEGNAVKEEL
jgi:ribosomal subunit interface protein